MPTSLVFDRIAVDAVALSERLPDGAAFDVRVRNVGEGRKRSKVVRAEAAGTAMACLDASERSVERWIAENVERRANAHENDGHKLRMLAQEGVLRFDSRYVLD
jgi:hypothetical protein